MVVLQVIIKYQVFLCITQPVINVSSWNFHHCMQHTQSYPYMLKTQFLRMYDAFIVPIFGHGKFGKLWRTLPCPVWINRFPCTLKVLVMKFTTSNKGHIRKFIFSYNDYMWPAMRKSTICNKKWFCARGFNTRLNFFDFFFFWYSESMVFCLSTHKFSSQYEVV